MLSAESLEGIEIQIREMIGNEEPMGGLQLILCGEEGLAPCCALMCVGTLCPEVTLSEHVYSVLCPTVPLSTLLCSRARSHGTEWRLNVRLYLWFLVCSYVCRGLLPAATRWVSYTHTHTHTHTAMDFQ